jgi:hypothetical protein
MPSSTRCAFDWAQVKVKAPISSNPLNNHFTERASALKELSGLIKRVLFEKLRAPGEGMRQAASTLVTCLDVNVSGCQCVYVSMCSRDATAAMPGTC